MPWSAIAFGWPAVAVALASFGLAFLTTHAWLGFIGAAAAASFCVFVSGYPLFHWVGQSRFVPIFYRHTCSIVVDKTSPSRGAVST